MWSSGNRALWKSRGGGVRGWLRAWRGRMTWGPTALPLDQGTYCLLLTHLPTQMKDLVLLCCAALISHQHIISSTQFSSTADFFFSFFGIAFSVEEKLLLFQLEIWLGLLRISADNPWEMSSEKTAFGLTVAQSLCRRLLYFQSWYYYWCIKGQFNPHPLTVPKINAFLDAACQVSFHRLW